ncbi:hypothetical protein [Streptomyces caelestis]|uniref:Secreted protein n=1 Tax=Streptomyces caelestis TaxID=36816 RepID=A0A7W9HA33_9ACTN|nr:hypothetical protein [Streptomyces caelestis]MBB5798467.1 hypothetical protein [Streptomyces caelestis]GGW50523.1 hypothetical protein GCM10010320_33940 [Streptomyces caelestis]
MRTVRALSAALLTLGLASAPAAADASPSPSQDSSAAPTRAGTSFRTATEIEQGQQATASGSTGDYLYWSFPADTGQRPTVRATVKLPDTHTAQTWQIDVYDGLRRRQACQYGAQTRTATADASSVELTCVLRTVRAWSEPWANDPLPGTYYIRLTATGVATADLGLPVGTEVRADSQDMGGAVAVDGSLSEPLVPGIATTSEDQRENAAVLAGLEPEDGWASGWWSDRWVWTGMGGVLAALAGIAGYALTRGAGRPSRVPPSA